MLFDIQKFAEEEVKEYGDILDGAIEENTEELPPIPEELAGMPEDIARDVMKKAGEISPQAPAQNQPQQQFNAEVIKKIDDAIKQRTMAISGLSKDDVDSMNYFEDDDPRIQIWNHAKKLSEASVYNDIIANHIAQQHELQRMQYLQNKSVNDYNNYVAQKQATENFDAVRQFAINAGKQDLNAALTSLSNLSKSADKMIYTNAPNSYVTTDLTAFKLFAKEMPTAEISAVYYVLKDDMYDRLKNYGSVNCSTSQRVVIFKTPEQVVDLTYNKKAA